ncbi:MAG: ATPase [Kiritimatiellae bacterium]|nr:ATPase [Kiritimatiellia bacterium]
MFVGREHEMELLSGLWRKAGPSLVICRGRRRIGKSTLIQQFARTAERFLDLQGLAPEKTDNAAQMRAVIRQLADQANVPMVNCDDWQQVFGLMDMAIREGEKTVLLLDEISWMAAHDAHFAAKLKVAWDTKFRRHQRLVVVLCGSVTSWIDNHILNNTGFVGRVSLDLLPQELPLHHCAAFWRRKRERVSSMEKLKVLSVTGGVPKYLEEIRPDLSAEENIRRMCFLPEGLLFHEFSHIFGSIFDRRAPTYKTIVGALVDGALSLSEIGERIGWARSGTLSRYLDDLMQSGFLAREHGYSPRTTRQLKATRFRLKDNYLRFYLKFVEPMRERIASGLLVRTPLDSFLNWDTIIGLQFENLVLNNLPALLDRMGIAAASVLAASPYWQRPTRQHGGCQIDLLIQTRYARYPCEIRFRKLIDRSVIDEMQRKLSNLTLPAMASVRPVLIYEGELSGSVRDEDFFDHVIAFSRLLTAP